jgi:hypothetical protein
MDSTVDISMTSCSLACIIITLDLITTASMNRNHGEQVCVICVPQKTGGSMCTEELKSRGSLSAALSHAGDGPWSQMKSIMFLSSHTKQSVTHNLAT